MKIYMNSRHDADVPKASQHAAPNEPAPAPPSPPSTPTEPPPPPPPSPPPQELPQPDPAPDPGQAPTPQAGPGYFYLRVRQRRQPVITHFRLTRIPPR